VAEAGVAFAAVGVEDLERCSPARWAGPIAGDDHLRSLPDDVPAEPDPRSASQLQPDAGRLADGGRETGAAGRPRRLEHDERDPGPAREGRHSGEAIGEPGGTRRACRQVDDQEVDRPTGQQGAGDRQAFNGVRRGHDDEPRQLDPARHGLDRVERRREVQPRDDRAGRLRLGHEAECERRPPARGAATQRDAHPARHAAGPEDRIELGEARREDAVRVGSRLGDGCLERHRGEWHRGERPHDLANHVARRRPQDPRPTQHIRRGHAPTRSKRRQSRGQVLGGSRHGRVSIEQMFDTRKTSLRKLPNVTGLSAQDSWQVGLGLASDPSRNDERSQNRSRTRPAGQLATGLPRKAGAVGQPAEAARAAEAEW